MKTVSRNLMSLFYLKLMTVVTGVFITHCSFGQLIENPKLSPGLLNEIGSTKIKAAILLEVTIENDKIPAEIYKPVYQARKIFESSVFSVYRLFASAEEVNSILLPSP